MAERGRRGFFSRFRRGRRADPNDAAKLGQLLGATTDPTQSAHPPLDWDYKTLASMSKIGQATGKGSVSAGTEPQVSYNLLRDISLKSEVVNAILRRTVDDCLGNGYNFILPPDRESGSQSQLEAVREFFKHPNPDDMGNEWLESLIYDLALFGDAYLELDGSKDKSLDKDGTKWAFGGELVAVWPIPAETMRLTAGNKRPAPPAMAYKQSLGGKTRMFASDKIVHVSKFKHGRAYGTSPLIACLNVIAGHLNLSNYLNELYTGTLPKTILNVGDISNSEMKAMLGLLEQQLSGGKSPFGLVAVNGGSGFTMHRILDSTREGAQLDLLYYYREEICAVFGIPPMKLGWVQTGKMSNPEQQLDAWYDVIDSFHRRIEALINNRILPLLGITDWLFDFKNIRPAREKELAEMRAKESTAISNLRQEGIISVNEARNLLGLERIDDADGVADDPFYLSPKLSINAGADNFEDGEPEPEGEPSLGDLFPAPEAPADEGKGAGEIPDWVIDLVDHDLSEDIRLNMREMRTKRSDEFDTLIGDSTVALDADFNAGQEAFASRVINELDKLFSDGDEAVEIPDIDLEIPVKAYRRKATISLNEIEAAFISVDAEIALSIEAQSIAAELVLVDIYGDSLALTLGGTGIAAAMGADDMAAIAYWRSRWVLPALRRTLGAHRKHITGVFEKMITRGESWRWAKSEMRSLIDPSGAKYPSYWYERIARTETRRVVENSHVSGMRKAGFTYVQRLVEIDDRTDRDLCAPYEEAVYPIAEARSVIPAHPNCRCTFVAYEGTPEDVVAPADILHPDIETLPEREGGE